MLADTSIHFHPICFFCPSHMLPKMYSALAKQSIAVANEHKIRNHVTMIFLQVHKYHLLKYPLQTDNNLDSHLSG